MLLRKDCGGNEHRDLTVVLHRLEGRAERDLGLSVAHISADQAVHDARAFHVALGVLDGFKLIVGLLVREHLFKFPLPLGIRAVSMPLFSCAESIELHKLFRDLGNSMLNA